MAHTPGPWTTGTHGYGKARYSAPSEKFRRVMGGGYELCRVWVGDPDAEPEDAFPDNLRLIAAAPELLDALRSFIELHDDGSLHIDGSPSTEDPVITAARAAIAKAEGVTMEGTNGKERSLD